MKNYEKYEEKIREYKGETFCADFVRPYILKQDDCCRMDCGQCNMLQLMWLLKEYEEPEVDWSQVEVDTPILVKYSETGKWKKRYFAKVEDGVVYAWNNGKTSWTTEAMTDWDYAKLAEDAEDAKDNKESEVDWNEVKIDTQILVKDHEDKEWLKRYFAKYEDGYVYAWGNGCTSWNADNMYAWNYTKLAESEEPKVDWNEVKIDTPIMVRDSENGDWFKRHFAEYKNGKIYTWDNGHTSWETSRMIEWKYAKLIEDEE